MWYQQQPVPIFLYSATSCDLLKNIYLCGINNNIQMKEVYHMVSCDLLKNIYLCGINNNNCCDLLKNIYLCGINNNSRDNIITMTIVVICLKISTFVVSTTTFITFTRLRYEL